MHAAGPAARPALSFLNDVITLIRAGLVTGPSFAFPVEAIEEAWNMDALAILVRDVRDLLCASSSLWDGRAGRLQMVSLGVWVCNWLFAFHRPRDY
jgi:hypothetical protein